MAHSVKAIVVTAAVTRRSSDRWNESKCFLLSSTPWVSEQCAFVYTGHYNTTSSNKSRELSRWIRNSRRTSHQRPSAVYYQEKVFILIFFPLRQWLMRCLSISSRYRMMSTLLNIRIHNNNDHQLLLLLLLISCDHSWPISRLCAKRKFLLLPFFSFGSTQKTGRMASYDTVHRDEVSCQRLRKEEETVANFNI